MLSRKYFFKKSAKNKKKPVDCWFKKNKEKEKRLLHPRTTKNNFF
jgi:hypothetical protein